MTNSLEEYTHRIKGNDKNLFLGELTWFSVGEGAGVQHEILADTLRSLDLESFIPRPPRDDDVFRRTCSQHQRKRVPTDTDGVFENYLIRDVKRGLGQVIKQIVVEKVDGANKRLDYTPAISLQFDSATSKISVNPISFHPDDQVLNVVELILYDYEQERGVVNSYGIRDLIRGVLSMVGATSVRPGGGVYFVMQSKVEFIDSLEKLSSGIGQVNVHSVPLIDDRRQREMIRCAIESETNGEIDTTLDCIQTLIEGPEISGEKFMSMSYKMRTLRLRTEEYKELLDDTLAATAFRLKVLETKMLELYDHTK